MHMAQLMPLPLTVSCFSKIQIEDRGPLNMCVCVFFYVTFVFLILCSRLSWLLSVFKHLLSLYRVCVVDWQIVPPSGSEDQPRRDLKTSGTTAAAAAVEHTSRQCGDVVCEHGAVCVTDAQHTGGQHRCECRFNCDAVRFVSNSLVSK